MGIFTPIKNIIKPSPKPEPKTPEYMSKEGVSYGKGGEVMTGKPGFETSKGSSTYVPSNNSKTPVKRSGGGGGGSSSSGGGSQINPVTGQGEYVLPSGGKVAATPETKKAIVSGKSEIDIMLTGSRGGGYAPQGLNIGKGSSSGYGSGAFAVSKEEASTAKAMGSFSNVPSYVPQATTFQEAITEGGIIGSTTLSYSGSTLNPVTTRGQFEFNVGQIARAQDQAKYVSDFYKSPDTKGIGTSTADGISYTLDQEKFNKEFYGKEAQLKYNLAGREAFESLPQVERTKLQTYGDISAVTKFGAGVIELPGRAITFVTGTKYDENIYGISGIVPGAGESISTPSVPSIYSTTTIPIIGVDVPTRIRDIPGYITELPGRSEQVLAIGAAGLIGTQIVKGGINAVSLYKSERAMGVSKLGALNIVGGEAAATVFMKGNRITVDEYGLKPYKTSQVNKGSEIVSVRIGEFGEAQSFKITQGESISVTPKFNVVSSYKPKLFGKFEGTTKSFETGQVQITSIKDNLFNVKPTEQVDIFKVSGSGKRDVVTFTTDIFQSGRYYTDSKISLQKSTQAFESYGKAKVFDLQSGKKLSVSFDRSTFKPIERQTYYGGYKAFGKEYAPKFIQEGKAFGSGISGRPSTAKSGGFNIEIGKIESEQGKTIFGKSFSKFESGGRRGVQYFNTKTILPEKNLFEVKADQSFRPQETSPPGFRIERIEQKPFDLLPRQETIPQQKIVETSAQSVLAPSKPVFGKGTQMLESKGGVVIEPKYETRGELKSITGTGQITKQSAGLGFGDMFKPTEIFTTKTPTRERDILGSALVPAQATQQKQITSQDYGFGRPTITPTPTPGGFDFTGFTPFIGGGLIIPGLGIPEYTPGGRRTGRQKKRRTPSIVSAELGWTTSAPRMAEITGLVSRDIITGKRRKKR